MRAVTPLMTTDNLNYSIMFYKLFWGENSTDSKMVCNIRQKSITLISAAKKESVLEGVTKEI
jgi:hypothetical protein